MLNCIVLYCNLEWTIQCRQLDMTRSFEVKSKYNGVVGMLSFYHSKLFALNFLLNRNWFDELSSNSCLEN